MLSIDFTALFLQKQFPLKNSKAHAAVLAANLIFGINFSVVQYITKKMVGPFGLNVIRVGVSSILLWILLFFSSTKAGIKKEHIGRFILCAFTGIFVNQMLFIKGLSMTLSIHASLLILVTPIFITMVAAWLGTEPATFTKVAGLVIGISGAVLLALQKEHSGNASDILWGDIFVIINGISYAFYFVLVKPLMKAYNPVHVIRWVFTFGLLFTLPFGWNQFAAIPWSDFQVADIAAVSFIVLGATFCTYLFNLYGIHHLGAGITGTYIYTQPIFAAIIAVIFLGERFTFYKIIAALLIVAGVLLVNKKSTAPLDT
jgi:drug/metabolite transporter (DMT)-like permease